MATAGESSGAGNPSVSANQSETTDGRSGNFECNVCFDTAKDAVVSMCGHLFW